MKRTRTRKTGTAVCTCLLLLAVSISHAKQTDLFFDYSRKIRVSTAQKANNSNEAKPQTALEKIKEQETAVVEKMFEVIMNEVAESSHSTRTMTTSDLLSLSVELPNNASDFDRLIGEMVQGV